MLDTLLHQPPASWVGIVYAVMSVFTFIAYFLDKVAAQHELRRIPEVVLHLLAVMGGWPGGLLAQQLFRHKTSKSTFLLKFWAMTAINGGMLVVITGTG